MKRLLLALIAVFVAGGVTYAQQMTGEQPYSYTNNLSEAGVPTEHLPKLDMNKIALEDADDELNGRLQLFSRYHFVDFTLGNSGQWIDLGNGDRLWRLRLESQQALALTLGFNDFHIPDGAEMYVFNEERTEAIGAFTSINNKKVKEFATQHVHGDVIIVEYFEPASAHGQGIIDFEWVGHCYRNITPLEADLQKGSDPCEVDINCSEGDPYWDEKKGVCRIAVASSGGQGWCTGSLVNNTALDCKQYVLTALHCGNPTSSQQFNQYVFYFNYERPSCASGIAHSDAMTGCTRRADSNDNGGNNGSDFLLVEINDPIPQNYEVYYNGWDAGTTPSASGVCIHHPAGDAKKISTYTTMLSTTSWGIGGTHWRAYWIATANGHGVTEGGSSGSPIFNPDSRIVGTLTGGSSFCTSPNAPDAYGKMDKHWDDNPNSASEKLKEWLDPGSTGTLEIDGSFSPCGAYVSVSESILEDAVEVFPNPTEGLFNLTFGKYDINNVQVFIYNSVGELVEKLQFDNGVSQVQLDLSDQANGLYYVSIQHHNVAITKKISVAR